MKHIQCSAISALILVVLMSSPVPLLASDPITVPWIDVCRVASGNEILVTTATGELVEGYCVQININEIAVNTTDKKVVRIARTTISRLDMHRAKRHQLRSLRNDVRDGLRWSFESMLSPYAPLGIAGIPLTLAWGAAAAPFCLVGDLKAKASGMREIRPN